VDKTNLPANVDKLFFALSAYNCRDISLFRCAVPEEVIPTVLVINLRLLMLLSPLSGRPKLT
jgi:hypothetical protein